jgi:hypothetical protein
MHVLEPNGRALNKVLYIISHSKPIAKPKMLLQSTGPTIAEFRLSKEPRNITFSPSEEGFAKAKVRAATDIIPSTILLHKCRSNLK